jgi:hypothetical protein
MLTRIVLFGFVLAAALIASARAQDGDYARKIGSSDGVSCEYEYSLSKLPSSAADSDKAAPYRLRVQKIECNGRDMGATDEDVDLKYEMKYKHGKAVIKTSVIGDLTAMVFGDETKSRFELLLKPSQIKRIRDLSWIRLGRTEPARPRGGR